MPFLDWDVMPHGVTHRRAGVYVRFDGPQGAYSGHGSTKALARAHSQHREYAHLEIVNVENPYHTKDWGRLVALVDEARELFAPRFVHP